MAEPINFDKSLLRLQFTFQYSGLTLESKKLTPTNKLKIRCLYLFNFLWLNSDLLGSVYWFINGIQTGKTFVELTYVAPCITFSYLANLKAMFLIYYETSISDLIEKLRRLEMKHEYMSNKLKINENRFENEIKRLNRKNKGAEEKYEKVIVRRKYIKFLHTILKCSDVLSIVLIVMFIASPLILIALNYYQTKEVELILPFLILYPFDSHDIRYWPFVYLHQFWSVCIVLLNICAADNLLYVCCTYLGVQFRLLQYDIKNVVENNLILVDRELESKEKCVQLVKWHQELIWLASMLEFVYGKSTLFNFVSSSVIICLTGFNVIAMENVAFAVTFLVFLSTSLLQIYMLCFFGDFLMKSSMEVSDAVYNSTWYLDGKLWKNLHIIQTRAQKPCKLTAFGFSDVNLKAFMSILRNAWSYFALLKTAYSPSKN